MFRSRYDIMRNGAKARFPHRKAVPIHLESVSVNKFRLSLMAAAAIGVALSAQVFAQGYNGLMPDNKPSQSTSKGDDTFGGIVAPAPGTKQPDEPPGYTGLIPGKTDKAAEAAPDPYDEDRKLRDTPASKVKYKKVENPFAPKKLQSNNKVSFGEAPKITYKPGYRPGEEFPLTVEQLKLLSTLSANGMDFNRLNAKTEARVGLPPGTSKMLNALKTPRIDGMLPPEFATKATVDAVMQIVGEREGEDRRKAAAAAYDRLSVMADGFRTMNSAPSSLYVKMGASDMYIKERGEGYGKSLDRLQEAMEALQKIKRGE